MYDKNNSNLQIYLVISPENDEKVQNYIKVTRFTIVQQLGKEQKD
jgi:hypothetical protein